MSRRLRQRATYLAFRSAAGGMRLLPERAASLVASGVGTALAFRPHGDLAMRKKHVARVLASTSPCVAPDPGVVHRLAVRSYRSYARYWVEGARLPGTDIAELRRRLLLDWGYARLEEALASGRGVVLALPHVGSWEWGGAFLAGEGHPMTSVAERVQPVELFEWFLRQREALGLRILALGDDSGPRLLKELRDGGLVGLVCDRDIAGNGAEVELFGERTTMPSGPAMLALRTDAVLLPGVVFSGPGPFHYAVVTSPVDTTRRGRLRSDVERVTQELAHRFEWMVRRAPEQWHLFQPNWPSDLGPGPGPAPHA